MDFLCLSFWLFQVRHEALQTLCLAPASDILSSESWPSLRKHLTISLADPDASFSVRECFVSNYKICIQRKDCQRGVRSYIYIISCLAGFKTFYYLCVNHMNYFLKWQIEDSIKFWFKGLQQAFKRIFRHQSVICISVKTFEFLLAKMHVKKWTKLLCKIGHVNISCSSQVYAPWWWENDT